MRMSWSCCLRYTCKYNILCIYIYIILYILYIYTYTFKVRQLEAEAKRQHDHADSRRTCGRHRLQRWGRVDWSTRGWPRKPKQRIQFWVKFAWCVQIMQRISKNAGIESLKSTDPTDVNQLLRFAHILQAFCKSGACVFVFGGHFCLFVISTHHVFSQAVSSKELQRLQSMHGEDQRLIEVGNRWEKWFEKTTAMLCDLNNSMLDGYVFWFYILYIYIDSIK